MQMLPFVPRNAACFGILVLSLYTCTRPASAQAPGLDQGGLAQVLDRLDRLEKQNHALMAELESLRRDLTAARTPSAAATLEERVAVQESRVEEQAQSKVESSQHLPVRLTGMALVNTYLNSRSTAGLEGARLASPDSAPLAGGATLQQTVLGFDFRGPQTFGGGQVHGSASMDFFGGSGRYSDQLFRLRTARLDIDWGSTSLMVGQDKPLIAPRDPDSLANVAYPALSDSGNLWRWQPQARLEQRIPWGENSGVRAQIGVFVTDEAYGYVPAGTQLQSARPAIQGRAAFWRRFSGSRRIEIAPGFHYSDSHVAQITVPSNLFSLDWFANPWSKLEFSGAFFTGRNVANLGGLYQGVTVYGDRVIPIHSKGGWGQLSYLATRRLTVNMFGGVHDNRDRDLYYVGIGRNFTYAGNLMYRLAPNVIVSFESAHVRTFYVSRGLRTNNNYDLALAYLF